MYKTESECNVRDGGIALIQFSHLLKNQHNSNSIWKPKGFSSVLTKTFGIKFHDLEQSLREKSNISFKSLILTIRTK